MQSGHLPRSDWSFIGIMATENVLILFVEEGYVDVAFLGICMRRMVASAIATMEVLKMGSATLLSPGSGYDGRYTHDLLLAPCVEPFV